LSAPDRLFRFSDFMTHPAVSVVIPCYNQGRFVGEAIASALGQTTRAAEVIVVDDGSDDDTRDVVARFAGVTYTWQPNRGLAQARNRGCHLSRGEYVVFLDSDDRLRADALAVGVRELEARPDAAFSFGRCVRVDEKGHPLPTVPPPLVDDIHDDIYSVLLTRNIIWTPGVVMFRRARCGRHLWFDPRFDAAADYDLYLRLTRYLPAVGHAHVIAEYRLHSASMSGDAALMLTTTLEVLRRHRPHVPAGKEALHRVAVRKWTHYYGEQLVEQIGRRIRARAPWAVVARDLFILARHYPRGLAHHLGRKAQSRRSRPAGAAAHVSDERSLSQEHETRSAVAVAAVAAGRESGPGAAND
jgi:glycosyltransferase involved in cell wall biosynthesis